MPRAKPGPRVLAGIELEIVRSAPSRDSASLGTHSFNTHGRFKILRLRRVWGRILVVDVVMMGRPSYCFVFDPDRMHFVNVHGEPLAANSDQLLAAVEE